VYPHYEQKSSRRYRCVGLYKKPSLYETVFYLVRLVGLEPTASGPPALRATNCAIVCHKQNSTTKNILMQSECFFYSPPEAHAIISRISLGGKPHAEPTGCANIGDPRK
jgi:hypothetical protein